ncbi:MAG: hypothetical protein ACI9TK_000912 [Flavobacteriaceae bacterium]|jgi:hypothetical protein|tara:strand:- start:1476 stop:3812 length:2337 start_codon:yes stop_codon:yes gene_type:complete
MRNLFFILLIQGTFIIAQKPKKEVQKSIDSLTQKMSKQQGLITTYQEDDKVFFEVSKELLEKDLLMVTRFVKLPANYQAYLNAGSKTSQQVIHFKKKGKQLLLTQESYVNFAQAKDPISLSVSLNNFPPVLASFDIKNKEEDRHLIDVSSYFNDDSPGFNIIRKGLKKEYGIGNPDSKRSFIDTISSFSKNTEIRHTLTYKATSAPRSNSTKTLSFQINHSIIALPENPMQIRYADERVGWFSLKKYNYSSEALKSDRFEIIRRWRLEPSDQEAYARGELVTPIKPIVYYLDPATPMKWRPYFKQGIEDWASVFEKAGFKNAIIARDPPSKEEDPEFSPEDIRFSTVRYVASTTRNATGPSVSDPRTGEIIESDITWYHNHLRSYRNRYLLETGAANPKARTLETPEEDIGEMIRRVISHEIGHALGLPHNMKASSAYSVDSLRSGSFTQKMGIATTIMDYARYNYIAQPGDENIRFVRKLGPYDDYSIEWGYRFFPNETSESEREILNKMVTNKSMNPIYMFGSGGNDPDTQTENIGDDPIKASFYGLKNLKIVAENLDSWTTPEGQSYEDLNELYNEMIGVYRRYIYHVISMVGGINETLMVKGQKNIPYKNLDKESQLNALLFLDKNLWKTQAWLIDTKLLSKIKDEGGLGIIQNLQVSALQRILSVKRLNRMHSSEITLEGNSLKVDELLDVLYYSLMIKKQPLDTFNKNLQIQFANSIITLLKEPKLYPTIKSSLEAIKKEITRIANKERKKGTKFQKNHYQYLLDLTKKESE